ncbi:MAG: hypothetical protein J7467_09990, partial [Chloroflexus sp.]|nr:hypothetical protein [Chloroflexus sp.]
PLDDDPVGSLMMSATEVVCWEPNSSYVSPSSPPGREEGDWEEGEGFAAFCITRTSGPPTQDRRRPDAEIAEKVTGAV